MDLLENSAGPGRSDFPDLPRPNNCIIHTPHNV